MLKYLVRSLDAIRNNIRKINKRKDGRDGEKKLGLSDAVIWRGYFRCNFSKRNLKVSDIVLILVKK